jgi:uncharacterized protein YhaN
MAARRLQEMEQAGVTEAGLKEASDACRLKLALADKEVQDAKAARVGLGIPITDAELDGLENSLAELRKIIGSKQQQLADKRASIRILCGSDPQGRIEELEEEAAALETDLTKEERGLAGLVLLEFVLNAEQQRLSRLVSEPLNKQIGPWLEEIRGKPTRLVLDEDGGRIAKIITMKGGSEEEIPFSEASSGLKGQIAFLLRLSLARSIAQQKRTRSFVILDDPLTETSPQRRPEMLRVLNQASEDLQILFVTCHDDVFARVPGQAHRVQL